VLNLLVNLAYQRATNELRLSRKTRSGEIGRIEAASVHQRTGKFRFEFVVGFIGGRIEERSRLKKLNRNSASS
jgi:hypothetical protein